MTTSTPLDPRSLAHRLTTVGRTLHHRLFARLRDSDLHPASALILGVVDGRIDSPWIRDRLTRGGALVSAVAERGWIERTDDGWALTAAGREILDRVDAEQSALLSAVPADELARLVAALDAVADALDIDDAEDDRAGFGPGFGPGPRGFGSRMRGFGPGLRHGFGPGLRGFGPGLRHGFGPDAHGHQGHRAHDEHVSGHHPHGAHVGDGCDRRHGAHGHRAAQHAYERGFDAGFSRGRESSASE